MYLCHKKVSFKAQSNKSVLPGLQSRIDFSRTRKLCMKSVCVGFEKILKYI